MEEPGDVEPRDVHRRVEAVWRIESPRVVAGLARVTRDVGLAEDFAQDALVAAMEQWPAEGVPDNPGAWLLSVGRRRAVDWFRRQETLARKEVELGRVLALSIASGELSGLADFEAVEEDIEDDLLRLVFTTCHPVLAPEARVALTLRLLGGLTTAEIARAYLVPEPTVAQRIVRAKKKLSSAGVGFSAPLPSEFAERLGSVLEVVYLIFNEGYSATAGSDWLRPELCHDALRLGRVLTGLLPRESEVWGLLALMEIQASRSRARLGRDGAPVLLMDQDRGRWDWAAVGRGLAALEKAEPLTDSLGPYGIQAAIAACHGRARTAEETDWARIAALYGLLAQMTKSPVVELNRAVAVSMASGPEAGLAVLEGLSGEVSLEGYHLVPGVRGDLLARLGRSGEARLEFERAAGLTQNEVERQVYLRRAEALSTGR
ncbi:RNA polymerase sigma factor [Knoellia sp. 3-2P3]|uniref:RNA polymerase sigma factor n=1 Tax=unclassified Knoellia TaxID=2618719 RepID=UPI0023DA6859|nr:RNA polymerase sigma factor [Knoellia sp. 3-2P3]MDF2091704.1 RNA polymerase sigma factor [Knoellia sp. 3-2P3]